jgi:hypothetical protein
LDLAFVASSKNSEHLPRLEEAALAGDPLKRYWAAVGMRILMDVGSKSTLEELSQDSHPAIRGIAAESLFLMGNVDAAEILFRDAQTRSLSKLQFLKLLNTLYHLDLLHQLPEGVVGRDQYSREMISRIRKDRE